MKGRRQHHERRHAVRPGLALLALGVVSLLGATTLGSIRASGWTKEGEIASVPDVFYLEQEAAKVATIARVNRSIAAEVDVDQVAERSPATARRIAKAVATTVAPASSGNGRADDDQGGGNRSGGDDTAPGTSGTDGTDGSGSSGNSSGSTDGGAGGTAGGGSGGGSSGGGAGSGSGGRNGGTDATTTTTTSVESPTTTTKPSNGRGHEKSKSTGTGGETADTSILNEAES